MDKWLAPCTYFFYFLIFQINFKISNNKIKCKSQETPESISVFENTHRTNNVMESLNNVMSAQIMGNTKFSRFYLGLREVEKTKARDAKLAKDTGGASKPKRKNVAKVSILCFFVSFIYDLIQLFIPFKGT